MNDKEHQAIISILDSYGIIRKAGAITDEICSEFAELRKEETQSEYCEPYLLSEKQLQKQRMKTLGINIEDQTFEQCVNSVISELEKILLLQNMEILRTNTINCGNIGDFIFSPLKNKRSVLKSILMEILQSEAVSSGKKITPHIKIHRFEQVVAKIESVLPLLNDEKRLMDVCDFYDAILDSPKRKQAGSTAIQNAEKQKPCTTK